MSVFNDIFSGMTRGLAFGMFGMNPFWGSSCCCCSPNILYYTSSFMGGGFFPVMPPITMPVFDMTMPQSQALNLDSSAMNFCIPSFKDLFKSYEALSKNQQNPYQQSIGFDTFERSGNSAVSSSNRSGSQQTSRSDAASVSAPSDNTPINTGKPLTQMSAEEKKQFKKELFVKIKDYYINKAEGGYNPNDCGQPGNHGVLQSTYDYYRKNIKNLPKQDVRKITNQEVIEIIEWIWNDSGADDVSDPILAFYVFAMDWGSGGKKGKMILSRTSYNSATTDPAKLEQYRKEFEQKRREYYNKVAERPDKRQYKEGWQNRVTWDHDFAYKVLAKA